MNLLKNITAGLALVITTMLVFTGCETLPTPGPATNPPVNLLTFRIGELVIDNFSGVDKQIQPHEERVKEDGTITLTLIGSVKAEGKTPGQLQEAIRNRYVTNGFYTPSLNVTVKAPDRYFYVGGEVRGANKYSWVEGMTIVKAIQNAGYFTDYAKRTKVRITRQDGKTFTVDYDKAIVDPSRDVPIYPGDSITVPKKIW